jgi:tripartite-type tricarboxylate transporter receptor subunit TctC
MPEARADALSDSYPTQPIRLIVPFPPGGGTDTGARIVAQKLGEALGQTVVVDNRGGAAGIIGTELAAKAAPDGYTLVMGNIGTHAINPALYRKLPYDPVRDFVPVTQVCALPMFLVVNPAVPAKSTSELIALAKAQPGKLNYASAGSGNAIHIAGELFKSMGGVDIVHVPYKGGAQATTAVLSGEVQMTFLSIAESVQNVKAERVRAIAVTGSRRSAAFPDVPTVAEAALPGYESISWLGIFAPAGTPPSIVAKLNATLVKVLGQPDVKEKLLGIGAEPIANSAEQFAAAQKADIAKYGKLLKEIGVEMQ